MHQPVDRKIIAAWIILLALCAFRCDRRSSGNSSSADKGEYRINSWIQRTRGKTQTTCAGCDEVGVLMLETSYGGDNFLALRKGEKIAGSNEH